MHRMKKAMGEMAIAANIPYDFQLYPTRFMVAAERKRMPSDLIASVQDGRLARECAAMREDAEYRVLLCEGRCHYTADGHLKMGGVDSRWTRTAIRNLLRSVRYVEGVDVEFTDSIPDTVAALVELHNYFDQPQHTSIRSRQRIESDWPYPTYQERYIYWLQGLPHINIRRARSIAAAYDTPAAVVAAAIDGSLHVKGIGRITAQAISRFLQGGNGASAKGAARDNTVAPSAR